LASALRYFREAAPKHTADEEQSLFPRLRRLGGVEVDRALAKMDELEKEHQQADVLHREIDQLGTSYLRQGSLSADEIERFREKVATLSAIYARHIGVEDRELFPVAHAALRDSEKLAIAKEMASRRTVKLNGV
jgi:hemerythrin-like domain-containing protein